MSHIPPNVIKTNVSIKIGKLYIANDQFIVRVTTKI